MCHNAGEFIRELEAAEGCPVDAIAVED